MSEMLERVAKAIRLRDTTDEYAMARAAIEAMREPSDAMAMSLGDQWGSGIEADWKKMIDEALK